MIDQALPNVVILISLKMIIESSIHERWIIPFMKFDMVRVNNRGKIIVSKVHLKILAHTKLSLYTILQKGAVSGDLMEKVSALQPRDHGFEMTMIPHMTPVLVGSSKQTRE